MTFQHLIVPPPLMDLVWALLQWLKSVRHPLVFFHFHASFSAVTRWWRVKSSEDGGILTAAVNPMLMLWVQFTLQLLIFRFLICVAHESKTILYTTLKVRTHQLHYYSIIEWKSSIELVRDKGDSPGFIAHVHLRLSSSFFLFYVVAAEPKPASGKMIHPQTPPPPPPHGWLCRSAIKRIFFSCGNCRNSRHPAYR